MSDQEVKVVDEGWSIKTKVIVGVGGLIALVLVYFFSVTVVPRWWARRIANASDQSMTTSTILGLIIGVAFTVLPAIVLAIGWRFRGTWKRILMTIAIAAVCAAPNLATLGISLGNGSGATKGARILDDDAPGFQTGTFIGIGIGILAALGVTWLTWSRRRLKNNAQIQSEQS